MLVCERCKCPNPEGKPLAMHGGKLKCDECIKMDRAILAEIGGSPPRPDRYWLRQGVPESAERPKLKPYWRADDGD